MMSPWREFAIASNAEEMTCRISTLCSMELDRMSISFEVVHIRVAVRESNRNYREYSMNVVHTLLNLMIHRPEYDIIRVSWRPVERPPAAFIAIGKYNVSLEPHNRSRSASENIGSRGHLFTKWSSHIKHCFLCVHLSRTRPCYFISFGRQLRTRSRSEIAIAIADCGLASSTNWISDGNTRLNASKAWPRSAEVSSVGVASCHVDYVRWSFNMSLTHHRRNPVAIMLVMMFRSCCFFLFLCECLCWDYFVRL